MILTELTFEWVTLWGALASMAISAKTTPRLRNSLVPGEKIYSGFARAARTLNSSLSFFFNSESLNSLHRQCCRVRARARWKNGNSLNRLHKRFILKLHFSWRGRCHY